MVPAQQVTIPEKVEVIILLRLLNQQNLIISNSPLNFFIMKTKSITFKKVDNISFSPDPDEDYGYAGEDIEEEWVPQEAW